MTFALTMPLEATELARPTPVDREAALARWCAEHDISNTDGAALAEASRMARVFVTGGEPRFDPAGFAELIEFIEELPF